jgi:excisionase family DNA binding protein
MNPRTKRLLTEAILTVEELSHYTGIKASTVQQRAARGRIHYVKKGNQLLFDKRDFQPQSRTRTD